MRALMSAVGSLVGRRNRRANSDPKHTKREPLRRTRFSLESLEARLLLHGGEPDLTDHYHPHLEIQLEGERLPLPANIGVDQTGVIAIVHTHDGTGLLHTHPFGGQPTLPRIPTIGDFFDVWRTNAGLAGDNPNAIFNQNQILDRVADADHVVRMFVNGVENNQFQNYQPRDGDQILITFEAIAAAGSPTLVPIGAQSLAAGKTRDVPLDGFDPEGSPLGFSVTSSNPNVTGQILSGNRSLRLNVTVNHVDGDATTGDLVFQLYEDLAPITTARIIELVNSGFYNGLTFHRVINDFMAQGGDPLGNGMGGTGVKFDDEFSTQLTFGGYGQLAMANSGDDTNDSQFFITDLDLKLAPTVEAQKSPPQHLNFNHTIFGQLTSGFDVLQAMLLADVTGSSPQRTIRINSATVFTDTENGVLRLAAPAGATGNSTITVIATDGTGATAQRSFQVDVLADTVNDRPFLGPLGNVNTTVNTPIDLPLPATDLENDTLTFVIRDPNSFFSQPANVIVSINQTTRVATLTPATNFTGTINLLVGVRDQTDRNGNFVLDELSEFDTQRITLMVNPETNTIRGRKFHDIDGDGTDDGGADPGLAGWTIQLDAGADGTIDAVTTTAADGTYRFVNLTPGTYRVREELLPGFIQTTANPDDIVLDGTNRATGVDFGNFLRFSIAGRKFHDIDGDGTDDGGADPGLAGWTIELDTGADGTVDDTAVTAADGTYRFLDLGPGVYSIREALQPGFVQTTPNPTDVSGTSGGDVSGIDFGNFQLVTISGRKFHDIDGRGTDDGGIDPGLGEWTIELDRGADGTVDATTVTADDGTYSFADLGPGTYRVREVLQTGWVQTTTDPANITVTSGTDVFGIDFGNFQLGSISGTKFEDHDGNGIRDIGLDQELEGWTLFLDANNNGELDDGERSTVTDADGRYSFTGLGPGIHRVREVVQSGWFQTTLPFPLPIESGTNISDFDFGNFRLITLSGHKFNDLDGDGSAREGGEPGLEGWTIFLDGNDSGELDDGERSTVTDADGNYSFADVGPGVHRVREVVQDGWINTFSIAGVVALSGQNLNDVNLGNFQLITISGRKFHDRDNDGTDNGGAETGLVGWVIELDIGANGTVDATTTTAPDGTYSFTNLGPGTYRLREQFQPGWVQTTANPADVTATSGTNVSGVDFGNFLPPVAITGQKFGDRNGDGVRDPGELGLEGWTIELDFEADGTVDFTTTTDASGLYGFTGLSAGTYRVREALQPGWVQTTPAPDDLVLATGEIASNVDFGNFRLITISGRKFDDSDGDGTDNGGSDPGLPDWTIELDIDADGTVDATATTAADGTYRFADLGPGTYRLREQLQTGWLQTTANPADIVATSGSDVSGVDFGNFERITISGRKFHDTDGDSTDNGGTEPGLSGWTIELDIDGDGTVDTTTTTAPDGVYMFTNLGPGTYRLREQLQNGWLQTTADPADIVAASGADVSGVDFGNFQRITISGRKFEDLDGDGTDSGGADPGLENWTIFLDENLNEAFDDGEPSVLTAADGAYEFAGLGPGLYRVREVLQAGWTQTTANSPDIVATSGVNVGLIDFGNFHRPTISGTKLEDFLGDGFTSDDTPLAGWTIELFRDDGDGQFDPASDTLADAVVTDASGRYEFLNVAPGTYFVREIVQDGWVQTEGPTFYTVDVAGAVSGETFAGNDFGNFRTISIAGFKINDRNGNGVLDGTDASQAGWTIFLDVNGNGVLDDGERRTTTADGSGQYTFTNVGPGVVRVREQLQAGWVQVAGDRDFVAQSGQDVSVVNFFNFRSFTISGVKFEDRNGNVVLDVDEPRLGGWTIFLDDNDNGVLDDDERSTVTADDTGEYSFTDLGPGTYSPREVVQPGWVQSSPNPLITATSGENRIDVNFGNFWLVRLSGQKFHDRNGNGIKDTDEIGVQGVLIFIDTNGDSVLDDGERRTVTASDGTYSFADIGPGTHQLREVVPPGQTKTVGPAVVQTTSGVDVAGLDFGNFVNIAISGVKFNDLDGDGTRDNGEPGLAGWTIFIDANGNGAFDSGEINVTTETDGQYVLSNVGPGTHRVREVLQTGWQQTTGAPADIVAVSDVNVPGVDFGNFQLITISGQKFEDRDGDGVKDAGEPRLDGWTIFLDDNDNGVLDDGERSTVTDADGSYSFSDLGPDEYRVREVLQTGWTRTLPSMTTTVVHIAESGRNLPDVDFGNFRLVTVSGQKFLDLNGNGSRDGDEPGLPGWTIFLDSNGNGSLDPDELSAVTDATGTFTISGVGPGTFRIEEVPMDGFRRTSFTSINVTSGTNLTGQDIGNLPELTAQIIQDPFDPDETALVVAGSDQDDRLSVTCGRRGQHFAHINGVKSGPFEPTGHVIILAFEGDDRLVLARCVTLPGQLDGGDGNDTMRGAKGDDLMMAGEGDDMMKGRGGDDHMEGDEGSNRMRGGRGNDMLRGGEEDDHMKGGRGHDIMVGMEGADKMVGGKGRDLMIGGEDADTMIGDRRDSGSHRNGPRNENAGDRTGKGRNQDIMIGGTTDYDLDDEALEAVLAEWTSRRSYDTRVENLRDGSGSTLALNKDFFLDSFSVLDDGAADRIRGGGGLDWFFATDDGPTRDRLRGQVRAEIVDILDEF